MKVYSILEIYLGKELVTILACRDYNDYSLDILERVIRDEFKEWIKGKAITEDNIIYFIEETTNEMYKLMNDSNRDSLQNKLDGEISCSKKINIKKYI